MSYNAAGLGRFFESLSESPSPHLRNCLCPSHRGFLPDKRTLSDDKCKTLIEDNVKKNKAPNLLDSVLSCVKTSQEAQRTMTRVNFIRPLTAKMAGNGGCVGTKYFGCIRFTGLLVNIDPLLSKHGESHLRARLKIFKHSLGDLKKMFFWFVC